MKILFACTFFCCLLSCNRAEKTGYININEVYSEINISKEYTKKLKTIETTFAQIISQKREVLNAQKEIVLAKNNPSQQDLSAIFAITQKLDSIENQYNKAFSDSTLKYNLKVEEVVNDLVYQYGLENKYTYLYSPATSNSFMYADSSLEVTTLVIDYINQHQAK